MTDAPCSRARATRPSGRAHAPRSAAGPRSRLPLPSVTKPWPRCPGRLPRPALQPALLRLCQIAPPPPFRCPFAPRDPPPVLPALPQSPLTFLSPSPREGRPALVRFSLTGPEPVGFGTWDRMRWEAAGSLRLAVWCPSSLCDTEHTSCIVPVSCASHYFASSCIPNALLV